MIDWWEQVLPQAARESDPLLARRLSQFTMATVDGMYVAGSVGEDWDTSALADMLVEAAGVSLLEIPARA